MSFVLDTNICSAYIKGAPGLIHRFIQHGGSLYISRITEAELYVWGYKFPDKRLKILNDFFGGVHFLEFDHACADSYGRTRRGHLGNGIASSPIDLLIASVALANDMTLVTHNTRDFQNIPGLRLEDWLQP